MTSFTEEPRIAARGIVLDDRGRYVLIRRVRTNGEEYLVTPGGGVKPGEAATDALRRECAEEMGAVVEVGEVLAVTYHAVPEPGGVQRFFLCRLVSIDDAAKDGHEFADPSRGTYETVFVDPDDPILQSLRPAEVAALLRTYSPWFGREVARLQVAGDSRPADGTDFGPSAP